MRVQTYGTGLIQATAWPSSSKFDLEQRLADYLVYGSYPDALWENFVVMERLKHRAYTGRYGNAYFWRTYNQQEVDLVEEYDGGLHGYEIKWRRPKSDRALKSWSEAYPEAVFKVISRDDYLDFVAQPQARA